MVIKRPRSLTSEGIRKLCKSLNTEFNKANIKIGRDTLFNILRNHSMITHRKKHRSKTANSLYRLYEYKNIIKDLKIIKPNPVWFCEITYIKTVKGFRCLALITSLYSREIVGYDIGDGL